MLTLALAAAAIMVIVGIPLAAVGFGVEFDSIVGLLGLFLSWPVVVFILVYIFMNRFRNGINYLLENVKSAELPGFKLQIQPEVLTPRPPGDVEISVPSSDEPAQLEEKLAAALESVQRLDEDERRDLEAQIALALEARKFWFFSYLALVFLPITKYVLAWFAAYSAMVFSRVTFDTLWLRVIATEQERKSILDALVKVGMLEENDRGLRVTEEGLDFLDFMHMQPEPDIPNRLPTWWQQSSRPPMHKYEPHFPPTPPSSHIPAAPPVWHPPPSLPPQDPMQGPPSSSPTNISPNPPGQT